MIAPPRSSDEGERKGAAQSLQSNESAEKV